MAGDDDKHPHDALGRWAAKGGGADAQAHQKAMLQYARRGHRNDAAPPPPPELHAKEASAGDFHKAFAAAFKDNKFKNHVTHYTEDQLKGMKLYTSGDGKVGVAVHDHGDGRVEATALFNNGGPKGGGSAMLKHAIDTAGVNYVECYGAALGNIYAKLGFKEQTKEKFNRAYAAPDWDFKQFDSPKYRTMKR
jgi:hypothetical protein